MAEAPDPGAPEITASVSSLAVSYVLRSRGQDGLKEILGRVGPEEISPLLAQPDLWISYAEAMVAVDAAADICQEPDIGYRLGEEAARFLFEQGRLQSLRGRPFDETMAALVELLNSSQALRRLRLEFATRDGHARIESTLLRDNRDRFLCRFGTAFINAVPAYLGRTGVATELDCITRGAGSCRFEVHWQAPLADPSVTNPVATPAAIATNPEAFANQDPEAVRQMLARVIEGLAFPQHVVAVRAALVRQEGGDEIAYNRGAADVAAGASFSAPIEGIPGMRGTATISFGGRGIPAVDQLLVESCAQQIGTTLADASTLSELHELARRDPLTGLANRKKLEEHASAVTDGTAVVFLDLDGFKGINDALGHLAGDALLEQLGERLRHAVRANDLIARYGGDEFVAMIETTQSVADAAVVAEKLLGAFDAPFDLDGEKVDLRASSGLARAPEDGRTLAELVAAADARMYEDKRRDR